MSRLFVEKSIEIAATAEKVWAVLTHPDLTYKWIQLWWPDLEILESKWLVGSPVNWRLADGLIGATGAVLVARPYEELRFSFKVNDPSISKQEELTYLLKEHSMQTALFVSVGDFGDTPEHEACYPGAEQSWSLSLPKIKQLSEQ